MVHHVHIGLNFKTEKFNLLRMLSTSTILKNLFPVNVYQTTVLFCARTVNDIEYRKTILRNFFYKLHLLHNKLNRIPITFIVLLYG